MSKITPVTHTEKVVAGQVDAVTHLEHVIAEYGGGNVYENLEAGTNILIEETADGKAKISASGEVSSEDTVARAEIAAIKDGETLDSFGDVETALTDKADTSDIPTVPITAIQKNGTGITPVSGTVNITVPTSAADVSALPDTTKYAAALSLTINSSTFVMTGQLKDQNGDNLGTAQTIDLPLESVVVGGSYNSQTKKVVLTLQNGNTIEFSVADLVSGLQTELSASNRLNPAYIDYDSTHRAVSDTEKSTWNGKQNAIDSSHKLSADNVDDTNATNKFATAEELEQIQTNKNNISTAQNELALFNHATGSTIFFSETQPVAEMISGSYWISTDGIKIATRNNNQLFSGKLLSGLWSTVDTISDSGHFAYRSFKTFLPAGTYTISFASAVNIVRQIADNVLTENTGTNLTEYTLTTTTDNYIGFSFRLTGSTMSPWDNSNIMLNAGSTAMSYEPYVTWA